VKLSSSWNFSTSVTDSYRTKGQASEFGINFSLTYSERTDGGKLGFAVNDDRLTRKTSGSYSWDQKSIAAGINVNKKTTTADTSISASAGNDLGSLQGSYGYSNKISSYSLLGRTGLYFADSAVAISNPGKQSFVVVKNTQADGDFEITSASGGKIAESKLFSSTVVGVADYSVLPFNITPKDQNSLFADSTKNYAYGAQHQAGGVVLFSNNNQVFVVTKVRSSDKKLAENVEINLICKSGEREIKQELITGNDGSLSFSAERGSACRLSSGTYQSSEITLDFMVKHKEIDDVFLNAPPSAK